MKTLSTIIRSFIILGLTGATLTAKAQLNPFETMYYQNQYLYNPSMAGLDKALNINLAYRQQWNGFPGTPKTGALTLDYQASERVGVGLNVVDEQAGLIRQTRVMGTYAYHLPLSDRNQKLNFGLSLGINDSRVNYSNINGDVSDMEIAQYNQLKPYVDGDFGISYTSNNLYIGSSVPNLKATFFKSSADRFDADRLLFITAASYKILLQNDEKGFILEPLAALRVVKGYTDIFDAGVNLKMSNYGLYLQAIYHSSQSVGIGFGFNQSSYMLNFSYNTQGGQLSSYNKGTFEFGLKVRLFKK